MAEIKAQQFTVEPDPGDPVAELSLRKIDQFSNPVAQIAFGNGSNTYLSFQTKPGETMVEQMLIDMDGNVGIGTATPGEKLEVAGTVKATAFDGNLNGGQITAGTIAEARIDAAIARDTEVSARFDPLSGHKHTGAAGDGAQISHGNLTNIAAADPASTDSQANKHVSNAQTKLWQDHLSVASGNPHGTTAAQVGAPVSVEGVTNPGGDIDLVNSNTITITSNNTTKQITIGESHSARTDNPHSTTATQLGALTSVDGVSNAGGNVDLVNSNAITIAGDNTTKQITIGETHSARTDNPHLTTAAQVGALPVNGGMLSGNLQVNGSIGIGTSPLDTLDVNGDVRVRGADIKDAGGTSRISLIDDGNLDLRDAGGTSRITIVDNGNLDLKEDGGAAALTINTEGKVGVGTSSMLSSFTVKGDYAFAASGTVATTAGSASLTGTGTSFLSQVGKGDRIYVYGITGVPGEYKTVTNIMSDTALTVDSVFAGARTGVQYNIYPSTMRVEDYSGNARFIISDTGSVGIGTLTPREKLEVAGTVKATAFDGKLDGSQLDAETRAKIQKVPLLLQTIYPKEAYMYSGYFSGVAFDGTSVWVANYFTATVSKIDIPTNTVAATVAVGKYPTGVAFAGGYIWVANQGSSTVSKIDVFTNTVVATITVDSPYGIAFDGTSLWVSSNTYSGSVSKINITDNKVIATVSVGSYAMGIALGGSHIWVANYYSNTVSKVDINTNTVLATVPVGTYPKQLAFSGFDIWVNNSGSSNVSRIDINTNAVTATVAVGSSPNGIAFNNNYIWAGRSNLSKIDIATNTVVATVSASSSSYGNSVAAAAGYIWAAGSSNGTVTKVDPSTNAVSATIGMGEFRGMAFDGTCVWAANFANHTVTKFDLARYSMPVATVAVGTNPHGIAFDGAFVWVTNSGSNTVSKIDVNTNTVTATVPVGTTPKGIAFDSTYQTIYVANSGSSTVSRIDRNSNTVAATITVGTNPSEIAHDGGYYVWVTNSGSSTVTKINYNSVITHITVGTNPTGIASDDFHIWVANTGSNTVSKIDPSTNTVVVTISLASNAKPDGLVFDGSAVWVSNTGNNTLSKIDRYADAASAVLFTSRSVSAFATGPLAFDGIYLWLIQSYDKSSLRKIKI